MMFMEDVRLHVGHAPRYDVLLHMNRRYDGIPAAVHAHACPVYGNAVVPLIVQLVAQVILYLYSLKPVGCPADIDCK